MLVRVCAADWSENGIITVGNNVVDLQIRAKLHMTQFHLRYVPGDLKKGIELLGIL